MTDPAAVSEGTNVQEAHTGPIDQASSDFALRAFFNFFSQVQQQQQPQPHPESQQTALVNAKQYRRILQRRKARAALEEYYKRKGVAARKRRAPYLHESRHKHAKKRPRGESGQFLNKEQLEEYYKKNPTEHPDYELKPQKTDGEPAVES